jgi:hypothetical protein
MPKKLEEGLEGSRNFHATMRNALRLTAVVRNAADGIVVELSDGRQCCFQQGLPPVRSVGIAAAVEWAKRHGACDIEVQS